MNYLIFITVVICFYTIMFISFQCLPILEMFYGFFRCFRMVKSILIKVPDELYYELKKKMAEYKCDKWLDFILKLSGIYPTPMETIYEKREIEEAVQSVDVQKRKTEPATSRQLKYLKRLCNALGKPFLKDYNQLTKDEASKIIQEFEKEAKRKRKE